MELLTLIAISIGLAMDAFAVSIGKGLSVQRIEPRHTMSVGLWFGGFQGLMPLIGYFLGVSFASLVQNIDHWIAFGLLSALCLYMLIHSNFKSSKKKDALFLSEEK